MSLPGLPEMHIAFEAGTQLEIDVREGDYFCDESDRCCPWIRIYREGDLSCGPVDREIIRVEPYSRKSVSADSLSAVPVPFIPYDQPDEVAAEFLKKHCPAALKATPYRRSPVSADPLAPADSPGLTVKQQRIREDASVFGQICFVETETGLYNAGEGRT